MAALQCPKCESTKLKEKVDKSRFVIVNDRECQDCGQVFSPPTPKWAPYGLLIAAVAAFVVAAFCVYAFFAEENMAPATRSKTLPGAGLLSVAGLGLLFTAIKVFRGTNKDNCMIDFSKSRER